MTVQRETERGIALMLLGILLFSMNDVIGKWLVATYSVGQVLLFRSLAALPLLLPFAGRPGAWAIFHRERVGLQVLRAVLSTAEVVLFYWAVVFLPLADVVTYYLASPIYVAAMAPFLLGERVGWRRWTAVALGFTGVVIALDPSRAAFTWPAGIALVGSFAFALMMVTGRQLRGVPDVSLVFWQIVGALLAGITTAGFGWVTPGPRDLALLGLLGIVATAAHLCVNRSLKLADAATVTPFQYLLLVWAVLFGFVIFGDVPKPAMLAGAAIIVASGVFILFRERRRGTSAANAPPPA